MSPSITPQELRRRMALGYLRGYQRAGVDVTMEQMERLAVADCELVDAARLAGDVKDQSRPDPAPARDVDDRAKAQRLIAEQTGTYTPKGRKFRPRTLDANPQAVGERWGYAAKRIERILEHRQGGTSSLTAAIEGSEMRDLALEYLEEYSRYYLLRSHASIGGKANRYFGVSDKDASRMFMRAVEDICDRSTGKLGSWYTK